MLLYIEIYIFQDLYIIDYLVDKILNKTIKKNYKKYTSVTSESALRNSINCDEFIII